MKDFKTLAELPDDSQYRVLVWFGHLIKTPGKSEARLQVAFSRYDPNIKPSGLFGSPGFYSTFHQTQTDKANRERYFEIYVIGVELIILLKLGSLWKGRREVGRVFAVKEGELNIARFSNIPGALVSNTDGNLFTYAQLFGTNSSYFVVPNAFMDTYIFRVVYEAEEPNGRKTNIQLLFPLTDLVRKFYFLSSHSVHGITTGQFTDLEKAPFEVSNEGIVVDAEGNKIAHINLLHSELSSKEATLIGMLLYSTPALEGARLVTDTLAASIWSGKGIISASKFPYNQGHISLDVRYKKVKLANGDWAFLVLEIVKCEGTRPFDIVAPHSKFRNDEGDGKDPVKYPPTLKFKNNLEPGFESVDSGLSPDGRISRVQLNPNDDLTSGYGGISVLRVKELPKGFKSTRNYKVIDGKDIKLATGFGDKNGAAAGTNIGEDTKATTKRKQATYFLEVHSLEFFKKAVMNIKKINEDVGLRREVFGSGDLNEKVLSKKEIKVELIVLKGRECSIPGDNKVESKTDWDCSIGTDNQEYPRRAVIAKVFFNGSYFFFFEFEKFKSEEHRMIGISEIGFQDIKTDKIILIFNELCRCKALYSNMITNQELNQYKIRNFNHKYGLRESYMTRRILAAITDKKSFTLLASRKNNRNDGLSD